MEGKNLSAGETTKRVMGEMQPGLIVLFRNATKHTLKALLGILENLVGRGNTLAPVSKFILPGDYAFDHTGRQCPTQQKTGRS